MNLFKAVSGLVGFSFAASAFAAGYDCVILRKKGDAQQLVKQFALKATPNEDTFSGGLIDGSYLAFCGIQLKASNKALICGFGNLKDTADVQSMNPGAEDIELLSAAIAEYGSPRIVSLHTSGEYQDIATCSKAAQ